MENQINMGDQNAQQVGKNPISQPVQIPEKLGINYWMISTIVLLVLLILGGLYTTSIKNVKISKNSDLSSTKQIDNLMPTSSTVNSPTQAANAKVEVEEFTTSVLTSRKDLQSKLADQEIQVVHADKNKNIWIAETIDKDYLKNGGTDQSALPRHAYLITNGYWKPVIREKLNVECLVDRFDQTTKTIIIQTNWNCQNSIYIYKLSDGILITFSDPKGLVPKDKPWILGGGIMKGVIPSDLGFGLLEVSYAGPNPYATAYYNVDDGKLLDLVLFESFMK